MNTQPPDILIAGASTRACAFSALRAGLRPVCFDQFADADLQAAARVERVDRYPHDLPRLMSPFTGVPWMYTGALENYPDIVAEISTAHPLLGTSPDVLRRVRDPFQVSEWLSAGGLPKIPLRRWDDPPPPDGTWLLKPLRGSAGMGIRVWDQQMARSVRPRRTHYFQRFLEGDSFSALFVGDGRSARLLGVTHQLIGCAAFHAAAFHYCGSVGPADISSDSTDELLRLGTILVERGGLTGVFGCDLIASQSNGALRNPFALVEVNPRYTASAEIIERAFGDSIAAAHFVGCGHPTSEPKISQCPTRYHGKAVLYALHDLVIREGAFGDHDQFTWPSVADVPFAGQSIGAGEPICTIFAASDANVADCERRLKDQSRIIYECLYERGV